MIGNLLSVFGTAIFSPNFVTNLAPVQATARYWRVFIEKVHSNAYGGLAELEMATAAGGLDVTTSGQAIFGVERGTNPAVNAFDDNPATSWNFGSNSLGSAWIGQVFPDPVTIKEVRLKARSDNFNAEAPAKFRLESSDDGATWVTQWTVDNIPPWDTGESRAYTGSSTYAELVPARYWRVIVGYPSESEYITISELEMASSKDGLNDTTTAQAIFGSERSTREAPNAFDRSVSTAWGPVEGVSPSLRWIGQDFGMPYSLKQISISARNDIYSTQAPTSFAVQYSDDLATWTTVRVFTQEAGWAQGEKRTYLLAPEYQDLRIARSVQFSIVRRDQLAVRSATKFAVVKRNQLAVRSATKFVVVRRDNLRSRGTTKFIIVRQPQ